MFYILLFLSLCLSISIHPSSIPLPLYSTTITSLHSIPLFYYTCLILYIFLGRWRLSDPHRILTTPAASSPSRGSLSFLIPTLYSFLSYVPVPYIGRRFWQDGDLLRKQPSYRPLPDPALVPRGEFYTSIFLVLKRMATDRYSFSPLTFMMKSNLPPTLPLPVITNPPPNSPVVSNNNTLPRRPKWLLEMRLETTPSHPFGNQAIMAFLPGFLEMGPQPRLEQHPGMPLHHRVVPVLFFPRFVTSSRSLIAVWTLHRARPSPQTPGLPPGQTLLPCPIIAQLLQWMPIPRGTDGMLNLPTWEVVDLRWCTLHMGIRWPTPVILNSTRHKWCLMRTSPTLELWAIPWTPRTSGDEATSPSRSPIFSGRGSMSTWIIRIPVRRTSKCSWLGQGYRSARYVYSWILKDYILLTTIRLATGSSTPEDDNCQRFGIKCEMVLATWTRSDSRLSAMSSIPRNRCPRLTDEDPNNSPNILITWCLKPCGTRAFWIYITTLESNCITSYGGRRDTRKGWIHLPNPYTCLRISFLLLLLGPHLSPERLTRSYFWYPYSIVLLRGSHSQRALEGPCIAATMQGTFFPLLGPNPNHACVVFGFS